MLGAKLTENPIKYAQAYNFGPHISDALSVEEMLKLSISSIGKGEYLIESNENLVHEAGLLKLDISKAIDEIKWSPKMSAEKTVNMTMDWYKEFSINQKGMNEFTENQILNFFNA